MGVTSIAAAVSAGTDVFTFQGDPPEGQTCQASSRVARKQSEKNHFNSVDAVHIMEQRIDPDLTKGLLTQDSDQVAVHEQTDDLQAESADLTAPEFNTRRRLSEQSESKQDKILIFGSVPLAVHEAHHKQEWPEEDPIVQNSGTRSPISITDSVPNNREIGSIALARRPTFGGRPNRHKPRDYNGSTTVDRIARSDTRSSLSQPRSRTQSPSNFTPPDKQPGAPGAYPYSQSFFASTPFSQTEIATNNGEESLPSPHTFGIPTPPHAKARQDMKRESHFNYQQAPPLPPLNHPAFRNKASDFGVLLENHEDKVTRHSHSLPSLPQARNVVKEGFKSANKKTRQRSKSSTGGSTAEKTRPEQPKWTFHSRTSSKSSVLSSRRSSAEYSAKQASSLHRDGCWEVDVSKAIIGLSLGGGPKNDNIRVSASNILSKEQVVSLGSPFFLQDPFAHNITRVQNDNRANVKPRYQVREGTAKQSSERVAIEMDREFVDIVTPITSPSLNPSPSTHATQISAGSAGSSPHNSISQRRGGRSDSLHSRTRTPSSPSPKRIDKAQAFSSIQGSSSLLVPPQLSITGPTPEASPISPVRRAHLKSTPTMPVKSILPPVIEKAHSSGSTKRKADEAGVGGDKTPPKELKATFAPEPKVNRASSSSSAHAPSSFHRSKRVRLTNSSEGGRSIPSRSGSRSGSLPVPGESFLNANNTGSMSSRGSHGSKSHTHPFNREFSYRDGPPLAPSASRTSHAHSIQSQRGNHAPSRRSLSQASIPISALVSPHAPSITRSGTFHMRDPRKPAPIQSTPWALSFPDHCQAGESRWALHGWVGRGGSPLHAWLFFFGFVCFPLWWAAAFIPIPKTRRLGGTDAEKGVILDDPQVEHDAKSWRFRCRIMALVSLFTYIPFIVLVIVFTRH